MAYTKFIAIFLLSIVTCDSNVHRLVNNFRDVDQSGNILFKLMDVTLI